jgi:hypothetical protein
VTAARIGFDALAVSPQVRPSSISDWRAFAVETVAAAPGAAWFYLDHRLVEAAAR